MSEPRRTRQPFLPWTTTLYAVAWAAVMLHGWGARFGGDPTSWLYDPATSSGRMVARDLERAVRQDDGREAAGELEVFLHGEADEVLAGSIEIQRDVIISLEESVDRADGSEQKSTQARVRLALLLAESGDLESAQEIARQIPDPDVSTVLGLIYGDPQRSESNLPADVDLLEILAAHGLEDWLLERPAIRLLESRGERAAAESIADHLNARGAGWRQRSNWLATANLLLIAIGIVSFAALRRKAATPGLPARPSGSIPPWDLPLGIGVLVRADFWNRLYFVVLGTVGAEFPDAQWLTPFYTWGTLIASLPLLWLIYRHLLEPARGDLLACFGFGATRLGIAELSAITLAALAIDLLGAYALGQGASSLGFAGHWAEGLDETLIWGSGTEVVQTTIDYLVWTPIFEELTFRGLLFYTLRRRLDPLSAAILSAGVFSSVHFYSLPGFLGTFWSGLVWALAFERARSLAPGIAAHAVYNLLYVAGIVALYR